MLQVLSYWLKTTSFAVDSQNIHPDKHNGHSPINDNDEDDDDDDDDDETGCPPPPQKAKAGLRQLIIIIPNNKDEAITITGILDFNHMKAFDMDLLVGFASRSKWWATLLLVIEKLSALKPEKF
ncbi:hypothetical protein LWI28_003776 [Acer negundo]|uniref:Uncharacterized protein n=1 Tax=Acer negundo TaxID=4023 RepID=A0AAD5NYF8_ACENE|nr:hypothetical protein LWI28_003776 [Acer negundo]